MPPRGRERTKFAADAMLGTLARKLRALGFDTTYYRSGDDAGLLEAASSEGRIILTSDRALAANAPSRGASAVLLSQRTDGARVSAVARACRERGIPLVRGDPLCSVCGGELETLRKGEVTGRVPPAVERRHNLFFRCAACGKLYWRGSHWKKLRSLANRLD
ncbi:MAG: hypothetical protein JRN08_07755 [Nitrososphaerota archaeon]|nr:hypothetical protein [Nitrososphaerota archaeon]